jgi:hypothetical protein
MAWGFGGGSPAGKEKCTNFSMFGCRNYTTKRVDGVPVCDDCNVYSFNTTTAHGDRHFVVVTKR